MNLAGPGLRVGDSGKVVNVMHPELGQEKQQAETRTLDHKQQLRANHFNEKQTLTSQSDTNIALKSHNQNQSQDRPSPRHSNSGSLPARYHHDSTPKPSSTSTPGRRHRYSRPPPKHPWFNGVIDSEPDEAPLVRLNPKYPAALYSKWTSMAGKGSTEDLYAIANEIANGRLKARKTQAEVRAAKARKMRKARLAAGPKLKISARSIANPLGAGTGKGTGAGGARKRRYYFQGYTGLSLSMDPETRVARINSRQRYPILKYNVVKPSAAAGATKTLGQQVHGQPPESRIDCHTATASYTLMRSACALYLNKTVQGYGTTLPRGQFMAQLILLNKKGAAGGGGGDRDLRAEARPKWTAAAAATGAVGASVKSVPVVQKKKRPSMLNWA